MLRNLSSRFPSTTVKASISFTVRHNSLEPKCRKEVFQVYRCNRGESHWSAAIGGYAIS